MLKVGFRVDSGRGIGNGHLYRCLVLADEIRQLMSADIQFICVEIPHNAINHIKSSGYKVSVIPFESSFNNDSEFDVYRDCINTSTIIKNDTIDILICDLFSITSSWEASVRKNIKKLVVIDDLCNRKYDADILVNQNFGYTSENYKFLVDSNCTLLCGPEYTILRPQFRNRIKTKQRNDIKFNNKPRVLVFMGGSSSDGIATKFIKVLYNNKLFNIYDITILISSNNEESVNIKDYFIKSNAFSFNVDVEDVASLLLLNDLVICAAGTFMWESLALNKRVLAIATSTNQLKVLRKLNDSQIVTTLSLADSENNIINIIHEQISIIKSKNYSDENMRNIVDGSGVERIVMRIINELS